MGVGGWGRRGCSCIAATKSQASSGASGSKALLSVARDFNVAQNDSRIDDLFPQFGSASAGERRGPGLEEDGSHVPWPAVCLARV